MDLPTLDLDGFKLAYRESRGTGHPIVLVQRNSGSSTTFGAQVDGLVGANHRVVAIDLPGHGGSDRFDDIASYGMPGYADILVRAAGVFGVANAVFAGWSLGGHQRGPRRRAGGSLAESFFAPGFAIELDPVIAEVVATDLHAREGLGASLHPDRYADEIEIVAMLDRPLAVLPRPPGEADERRLHRRTRDADTVAWRDPVPRYRPHAPDGRPRRVLRPGCGVDG